MSRRNYIHTMDALISRPMYSNLSGTSTSTSPIDVIGGGTLSGGVFTAPTNEGNTGVNTTPPDRNVYLGARNNVGIMKPISETVTPPTRNVYSGTRDSATPQAAPTPPILPTLVDEEPRPTRPTTFTLEPDDYGTRPPIPTTAPIIPIIVTPTPIITGGGYGGGGYGGGSGSSSAQKVVAPKPNFIKKNILPILLVGSAIYVIIKKPI